MNNDSNNEFIGSNSVFINDAAAFTGHDRPQVNGTEFSENGEPSQLLPSSSHSHTQTHETSGTTMAQNPTVGVMATTLRVFSNRQL